MTDTEPTGGTEPTPTAPAASPASPRPSAEPGDGSAPPHAGSDSGDGSPIPTADPSKPKIGDSRPAPVAAGGTPSRSGGATDGSQGREPGTGSNRNRRRRRRGRG